MVITMTSLFLLKVGGIYLLIYVVGLLFTVLSEITYKRRTLKEVKENFKQIWIRASIIYLIFVIASICYYFFGMKASYNGPHF